jgi:hypothetical protein
VRDEDLDRVGLGAALDARLELVLLVGRIEDVDELANGSADEVAWDLRAVLGEVGLHQPDLRVLDGEHEARLLPELARGVPCLLRRGLHHQPALVAGTHDLRVGVCGQEFGRACLVGAGGGEPVAVVTW